jgi:hypothetical protein
MQEIEKYKIGQIVYTTKDIRGWFDKSVKSFIPINTPCTIINIQLNLTTARYLVRFNNEFAEFGDYNINHIDLRLG